MDWCCKMASTAISLLLIYSFLSNLLMLQNTYKLPLFDLTQLSKQHFTLYFNLTPLPESRQKFSIEADSSALSGRGIYPYIIPHQPLLIFRLHYCVHSQLE